MKKRKLIMTLIFAVAAVASALCLFACADKPEYSRKHKFDEINANAVIHIEKNSLTFAKGMSVDTAGIIESCDCMLIDPDSGKQLEITAADLKNGMVSYERFDLDTVGRKKSIKLKFKQAENYILYDVIDFKVNFYVDGSSEPWKAASASASLDPEDLGLAVWVDTATYNYATDETARATDAERAIRFNGWFDADEQAATGRHTISIPNVGTERVVNLYADFFTAEDLAGYKLAYDTRGRLVFNGYEGEATEVVVPEGVTYINVQEVFKGVTAETPVGFKSLSIPSNAVIDVPFTAGVNTAGLEEIIVDGGSPRYSSYNGAMYSKDYTTLYFMPADNTDTEFHEMLTTFHMYSCAYWQMTTLALPESVTTLEQYCFFNSALTSVSGLDRVSLKNGWDLGSNIKPYEDGVALYTVLSKAGETPRYALSMIIDKNVTEYTVLSGTESIAGSAFYNCDKLTKINLGNDIKSIGDSAFSGCTSLEEVTLPSSLERMGEAVFYGCEALTKVTGLPDVTFIDGSDSYEHTLPSRTFYGCSSLTDITLPDGVVTIAPYAFNSCNKLTSINLPSTVENIANAAFEACGLTSIEFPVGLKAFGFASFRNCTALTEANLGDCVELETLARSGFYGAGLINVTLPEQITVIPDHCFYNMPALKTIDISGVETLDEYAISRNTSLTTITFGDKLRTIDTRALSSNTKLTNVVLPESVETIGGYAFAACTGLKSLTIGSKVVNIGVYTFESDGVSFAGGALTSPVFFQCSKLEEINVSEDNEKFISVDGVLYGKEVGGVTYDDKTAVLYAVPSNYKSAKLTLPATVKVILPYAAHYIRTKGATTEIELNEGLLNIGKAAFYNSTNLTSLTIPSTVTNIGASILLGCTNITDFVIADGNQKYTSDGNLVYDGNDVSMYLGISPEVEIRAGMTKIDMGVFMDNAKITSIVIPDSIVTIGEKAFSGCAALTSIHLGASVKDIDPSAFAFLSGLETITVSANNQYYKAIDNVLYTKDGKKVVLAAAKNGMTGLEQLESGVVEIGDYAFSYHKTLESVMLPSTVKNIGAYSFYECREVTRFYSSEALETMGERAFSFATSITPTDTKETRYCDALRTVVLYGNLAGIAENAFYGQYGIQYVYFKMTHAEAITLLHNSGKNYTYLTKGCPSADGDNGQRYNEVICALYSATEPTIDYDGYIWFMFDENGVPRPYNIER